MLTLAARTGVRYASRSVPRRAPTGLPGGGSTPTVSSVSPYVQQRPITSKSGPTNPEDYEKLGNFFSGVHPEKASALQDLLAAGSPTAEELGSVIDANPTFGKGRAGGGFFHSTADESVATNYGLLAALKAQKQSNPSGGFEPGVKGSVLPLQVFRKKGATNFEQFSGLLPKLTGKPGTVGLADLVNNPGVGTGVPGQDLAVPYSVAGRDDDSFHIQVGDTLEKELDQGSHDRLSTSQALELALAPNSGATKKK